VTKFTCPWQRRRRPGAHRHKSGENIKAVLFDFDGTLTAPGLIDFMAIKKEINCPDNSPILEFIAALHLADERCRADAVLRRYEERAARLARPNEHAVEIIRFLRDKGYKLGILTRNRLESLRTSFACLRNMVSDDFDVIVARENVMNLKPHPEGVLIAACSFGVLPREMAVVGDYVFDIEAGRRAGTLTVFLESDHTTRQPDPPADFTINKLSELRSIFGNE